MTFWFLVSLILTARGQPAADIPRPFVSRAECQAEGLKRAAEIASDKALAHGVWACLDVDFGIDDPMPAAPPAPLVKKEEG